MCKGFPGGSVVKNPPVNAGAMGSSPGEGRSPGGGMATYSSTLAGKIPMDREAWQASPWDYKELDRTGQLSTTQQHSCESLNTEPDVQ